MTDLTVDELARQAGVVVSTVRLYQSKGLLPPPVKRGRVGYYDADHLERMQVIAQLQERGFSLAGIKELLDGAEQGGTLRDVLGLGRSSIWAAEEAETMSLAELAARFQGVELTASVVRRVVELGLVELSADGTAVTVHSPALLRVGSELAALGIPMEDIFVEYEQLQARTDEIARRFTDLFRRRMWRPFVSKGMPGEQVPPLLEALEQLAPLAEEVAAVSLRHSLQGAAEAFARAEARRLGIAVGPSAPGRPR